MWEHDVSRGPAASCGPAAMVAASERNAGAAHETGAQAGVSVRARAYFAESEGALRWQLIVGLVCQQ